MDDSIRILELKSQGFYCSQILMLLGFDLQGKNDPDLIKSMQALAGGIGFSGHLCGALTGGACLLGLYAGKGRPGEEEDERLNLMLLDLTDWFEATIIPQYGGTDCDAIIEKDQRNIPQRCPPIVQAVFQKVKELLIEYGFDLSGSPEEN